MHPATHASHNAHGLLQVSRKATEVTQLSNTQKTKRAQEVLFNDQFDILLEKQFIELSAFAEKHKKKVEHLQKLISTSSHHKKERVVNLENAKLHAKSLEVNADCALGDCVKLSELRQLVKNDVRATADGGAGLAGDPKLNIFTEQLLQIAHLAGDPKRKG